LSGNAGLRMGVDHPRYRTVLDSLPTAIRESLMRDLNY